MSISNENSTTAASEKDCAQTPKWFMKSLLALTGKSEFKLDVCANAATAKADLYYSLDEREENALKLDWLDFNFCNPPFTNITPFIEKSAYEASRGNSTFMIIPNNPETAYVRKAKELADTIIEMPFRLKFLRPNGEKFLSPKGTENSPKFSCLVAIFTPIGIKASTRFMYHDFRVGFYK